MTVLHFDYETVSCADLEIVGLDNYAKDPTTRVGLCAYARDDRAPKLWEPHKSPQIPAELEDALLDPFTEAHAWNAAFERLITKHVLGIDKPIEEWRDPMANARYLSLPGSLEAAGEILKLKESEAKIEDGKRLIRLFCEPEDEGGEETLFGISEPTFRDWRTDPEDWAAFGVYCIQDVIAERTVEKKLLKFPLPVHEWETWFLSERINATGLPVDMTLVAGARGIVTREMKHLTDQLREITGLANPNSRNQFLAWIQERGYGFSSLNKTFVARATGGECDLTDEAKTAIAIRTQTAKSSVTKYTAIADTVSSDGRLRNAYQFMGAARTGRFSSLGANVGNLAKPTKQVEKNLSRAIELVQFSDYDRIKAEFGNPLEVVSSTLRSSFRAPAGMKFVIADLAAIEARGLAYLSRCPAMLRVFREGLDPYIEFATRMYGGTYEELFNEWKSGNSFKRTNSKPPVLGAGYGLGPGEEWIDADGNKVWSGLMGYARAMGVEMSREDCLAAIKIFRESYPEVKWLWKDMEVAAARAIRNPGQIVPVGVPQTEREQEYFSHKNRPIHEPIVHFKATGKRVLEMVLPSGRSLHYIDPIARNEEASYTDPETGNTRKYWRTVIEYQGKEVGSQQWGQVTTFGGKFVENCDQAVSRDVLVHGMKLAEQRGFEIVLHTYDEIGTLVPIDSGLGVKELCECMTASPAWCGNDFILGAEGFEDEVYRKG